MSLRVAFTVAAVANSVVTESSSATGGNHVRPNRIVAAKLLNVMQTGLGQ